MPSEPFILITCEHGGNAIPAEYAHLFRGQETVLQSHRGWDQGALLVAKQLAAQLSAPLLATTTSRLLIDNNRSVNHLQLFSKFSSQLSAKEKGEVAAHYYHPHRGQVQRAVLRAMAAGRSVLHLAVHSFTPVMNNEVRRVEVGLLYDSRRARERSLVLAWQTALQQAMPVWRIRRNAPYRGRSDGLTTWLRRQFDQSRYLGLELELNQKEVSTQAACHKVSELLRQTLETCLMPFIPHHDSPPSPGDEVVAIVNADNQVVGQATRREMRQHNLIHRATYILVFNSQGQLYVQKRTMGKDLYPGYHDVATGGVVLSGESYEESARRELLEELGVTAELEFLFDRFFSDEKNQVWGRVFRCRHNGPFVLQESEVESGEFMSVADILAAERRERLTPDGLEILAQVVAPESPK